MVQEVLHLPGNSKEHVQKTNSSHLQQAWTLGLKAFKNSGIRPLNPDIFAEADYAPSRVSSTQAHTPLTYPQAVFGYQPYTCLPCDDNNLSDGDPCDGENTDGEGYGDGDGNGNGTGTGDGADTDNGAGDGADADNGAGDGTDTDNGASNGADTDNGTGDGNGDGNGDGDSDGSEGGMDEDDQIIVATNYSNAPLHAGSSIHHQQTPQRAPIKLPAIVVGNLHQRQNSEHFKLDPELTQPQQLFQAMAEIQRLAE
ncbi:hypothetical protein F5148DRAFT_1279862 [Russula earlei]|uniref:Uncharacterized protein n=1 Tax=Russula earlei TaxID=71964 RepID=A0ACC0UL77_9AGAM|nr:hypothetical protein F5148DRAFT_1279862 [Russula earlei]